MTASDDDSANDGVRGDEPSEEVGFVSSLRGLAMALLTTAVIAVALLAVSLAAGALCAFGAGVVARWTGLPASHVLGAAVAVAAVAAISLHLSRLTSGWERTAQALEEVADRLDSGVENRVVEVLQDLHEAVEAEDKARGRGARRRDHLV